MSAFASQARLHHFGISVPNLDETVAWYTEKLGFVLDYRYEMAEPPARVAFVCWKGYRAEIFEVAGAVPMPESRRNAADDLRVAGMKHIAFGVENIESAVAQLKERGVEFLTEIGVTPESGGDRFILFRDNNGIVFELYQPARP